MLRNVFFRVSTGKIFKGTGDIYFVHRDATIFDKKTNRFINVTFDIETNSYVDENREIILNKHDLIYKCNMNNEYYCGFIMPNTNYPQYKYFGSDYKLFNVLKKYYNKFDLSNYTETLRRGILNISVTFVFTIPEPSLTDVKSHTDDLKKTGGSISDDWYNFKDIYYRQSTGGFMNGTGVWYIASNNAMKDVLNSDKLIMPQKRLKLLERCKLNNPNDNDCGIIMPNVLDKKGKYYPQYEYFRNEQQLMEEFIRMYSDEVEALTMSYPSKYIPYFKNGTVKTIIKNFDIRNQPIHKN